MKDRWLPHLENAIPESGQGNRISAYTISLEGWRRGLDLSFYSEFTEKGDRLLRYKLTGFGRTHEFQLSMGDKVTQEAFDICKDKALTKEYLMKGNVPVPIGRTFLEDATINEMIKYANSIGYPVVIKPKDSNAGKGVFANIQNEKELIHIINHVRNDLGFTKILLEEFVSGRECRVYVLDNRVIAAMYRVPANIKGDGEKTIEQLIKKKNKERKLNPHLSKRLIVIDEEIKQNLKEQGYQLTDILEKGKVLYLRMKSNLSQGGDAVDNTDELHPNVAEIAINAGKAIPGLIHYGVDIIINEEGNHGVVLEVNTRPGLGGHLFPGKGIARDVPKEIIDFYFPETKGFEINNFYFDFDSVVESLSKRTAGEVKFLKCPRGIKFGKKYLLESNLPKSVLNKKIFPKIKSHKLHGFINFTSGDHIVLVVSSTNKNDVDLFTNFLYTMENLIVIDEIDWDKPVKIGFEVIDEYSGISKAEIKNLMSKEKKLKRANKQNIKLKNKLSRVEKQVTDLEDELEKTKQTLMELEKKYLSVINSRSWRYTSYFRKLNKYFSKR